MLSRPPSDFSETTIESPPLSPSSATRSSVASSSSSYSLGEPSSRSSRKFVHDIALFSGVPEGRIREEELGSDMEQNVYPLDQNNEACGDYGESASRLRPPVPRQGSYPKRHSSFDTRREVPFPYGYFVRSGAALPDCSGPSGSSPLNTSVDPNHFVKDTPIEGRGQTSDRSNVESPPSHLSGIGRSTSSLPSPSSTPYSTFPSVSSPGSASLPHGSPARSAITSCSPTSTGFVSPHLVPTRTTSLRPLALKLESRTSPSPSRGAHLPRLSESPPFLADEPDFNEESSDSQSLLSHSSSSQDVPSHYSLPPPPKLPSSILFTSSSGFRPTSLPEPLVDASSSRLRTFPGDAPFPPPEPPTILTPPPPFSDADGKGRKPAPYEPFLPRDQPPPDHTYIAVETVPREYRLLVRLPGFQRDSITLAMRRRRILHVVADNWSDGGGHFERRISFGYDADLATVRAEFDGEILRIIVPRREPLGGFAQPTH